MKSLLVVFALLLVSCASPRSPLSERSEAVQDRTVRHEQNGSFNYSQAAANSNSENVIVIWNNDDLAASFMKHRQSRWDQGIDYKSGY
jgi:hypothetical protein